MRTVADWRTVEGSLAAPGGWVDGGALVQLAQAEVLVNSPLLERVLFDLERDAFLSLAVAADPDALLLEQAKLAAITILRTTIENVRFRAQQEVEGDAGR